MSFYKRVVYMVTVMILFNGCSPEAKDEMAKSIALTFVESLVSGETVTKLETLSSWPVPFNHPLQLEVEASLLPLYVQVTMGQNIASERLVTLVTEDALSQPKLVLVNEEEKTVDIFEPSVTLESEEASSNYAYTFDLMDLMEGANYQYGIMDDQSYSQVYQLDMSNVDESRLAIFGDIQGYLPEHYNEFGAFLSYVTLDQSPDMLMLLGDVVDTGSVQDQWDYYYSAMTGIDNRLPIIASIGNHDVKGSRDNFEKTFAYPNNGSPTLTGSTAYYDLPSARIAVLDTERPSLFGEQEEWLKQVIGTSPKKFNIVLMHRSVYPIFYVEPYMQVWAPIFESLGVDLVFSGHDHLYSRTEVNDVTYIVTGSGSGSKFYDQVAQRPWQEFVYDEDHAVAIMLTITEEQLSVKTYSYQENDLLLVDEIDWREAMNND